MLETYLFLTFNTAGLTHALKGVSLRPPICHESVAGVSLYPCREFVCIVDKLTVQWAYIEKVGMFEIVEASGHFELFICWVSKFHFVPFSHF